MNHIKQRPAAEILYGAGAQRDEERCKLHLSKIDVTDELRWLFCGVRMSDKNRWSSRDVALVALGIGAVVALQSYDSDDGCRYVYEKLLDCEAEWGNGACRLKDGKVYSPAQEQCYASHGHGSSGGHYGGGSGGDDPPAKGQHAISIERGGFGGFGRGGG